MDAYIYHTRLEDKDKRKKAFKRTENASYYRFLINKFDTVKK